MLCPKCGMHLPEQAAFCTRCGNNLQAAGLGNAGQPAAANPNAAMAGQQPAAQPTAQFKQPAWQQPRQNQASNPSDAFKRQDMPYRGQQVSAYAGNAKPSAFNVGASGFTPAGIISRILSLVALVAMFMPWLYIPILREAGNYAQMLGINYGLKTEYAMFELGDPIKTFCYIAGNQSLNIIYIVFFVIWIVVIVGLLAGLVYSFFGKKSLKLLVAATVLAAILAIVWTVVITVANGAIMDGMPSVFSGWTVALAVMPAVAVVLIASIASAVTGILGGRRQ